MITKLSNNNLLLLVFVAFTATTIYLHQTANPQNNTSLLKIESVEINRLNWEKVQIISDYTLDYVTATFGSSPVLEEKITIHDSRGELIYEGTDKNEITIPDAQLGNKEKLSVNYCITRKEKTVCEQKTIFASPKQLSINPTVNYPFNNRIFLGEFKLNPVLERTIFGQTNNVEVVDTDFKKLNGALKLITKGNSAEISIPIAGKTGIFDISNSDDYQLFKRHIQQAIYNEKLDFNFETDVEITGAKASFPIVVEKENNIVDSRLNVALQAPMPPVTAIPSVLESIDCEELEIAPIAKNNTPIAKEKLTVIPAPVVLEEDPADCEEPVVVIEKEENTVLDLHIPMEAKFDLFEAIPAPEVLVNKTPIQEKVDPISLLEQPIAVAPKPTVVVKKETPKEEKKVSVKKKTTVVNKDYSELAMNYASAVEKYIIRLVHSDPTLSKTTKVKSWKRNKSTGKLSIQLSVDWVDRWMEDNFQVDGLLTVDEDGKNATFKMINKNQTIKDLEEFSSVPTKETFFIHSL